MAKKSTRRLSPRPKSPASWLRQPAVQLGLLGVIALVIVFIVLSGSSSSVSADKLPLNITPDQAYTLYQQNSVLFVDVREAYEWENYHIPNSTLLPLSQLESKIDTLPRDKPIIFVCESGSRSSSARDLLRRAGFTRVSSLVGGLPDWMQLKYPYATGK